MLLSRLEGWEDEVTEGSSSAMRQLLLAESWLGEWETTGERQKRSK